MVPLALCHIFETVTSIKDRFQTLELFTLNVHFWDSQVPTTHSQEILKLGWEPVHLYECSLHRKWKIRRAQGQTNSFQSQKQLQGRDKCKKRKPGNMNNAEHCKEGPKVKRKKQLGNSSGDNAEWWGKVRRGNQKWSRGHRHVYMHLPRAIQAADKLQQM